MQPDRPERSKGNTGPLLVSACLIGEACRHDGRDALAPAVRTLMEGGQAAACCPEELGGLGTPRPPAEIKGGTGRDVLDRRAKVVTKDGEDVTGAYLRGARRALRIAQELGVRGVILKSRSPSCGVHEIYDGSFSGQRMRGEGVTAALLQRHGIPVMTEADVTEHGVERVLAMFDEPELVDDARQPMLTVRLFAAAREAAGSEVIELPWDHGGHVARLRTELPEQVPALAELMPHLTVAVNGRRVRDDVQIAPQDEVALLPPVSGGAGPTADALDDTVSWRISGHGDAFALHSEPLRAEPLLRRVDHEEAGAVVSFVGSVRGLTGSQETVRLEYEAYETMALECMERLAGQARRRWPICRVAMIHRTGKVPVNQWAVVVAVSTPHRAEAFAAGRFLIDRLKVELPIWKKEIGPGGSVWVGLGG